VANRLRRKRKIGIGLARRAGHTYQSIADQLGCNRDTARDAVRRAFDRETEEVKESTEELRQLQVARLEHCLSVLAPQINAGDVKAVLAAVKIIQETNKLLGLYLPVKQQVELTSQMNLQEIQAELLKRIEGIPD
jgi:predicted transcriptional regulator